MTSLLDALFACFLSFVLNLWIVTRIRKGFPADEGRFLAKVYLWTLLLRHVGAIFLNIYSADSKFADTFWGDSGTYDWGGSLLALKWSDPVFVMPVSDLGVSGWGFTYFVGAIYYVFGRNQLLVQFINAAIGSLSAIVIYVIAKDLFDARSARWAAAFMAFFPQMIFWSCAMYKDPAVLFCIALTMLSVLRLRERFTFRYLALFVVASLALMTLRFYVFYMVAFATLATFLFAQRRGFLGNIAGQLTLVIVFIAAMVFGVRNETIEQQQSYLDLQTLQRARMDQVNLSKSSYGEKVDVSTPEGALSALPIGLAFLLFAPFPWAVSGLRQGLVLPETLVWYALMPALVRGLRYTLRERFRAALAIFVFAGILITAYAIFQSNVGTAYRQRTQVTMFFFIFMGAGIEQKRLRRQQQAQVTLAAGPVWQR